MVHKRRRQSTFSPLGTDSKRTRPWARGRITNWCVETIAGWLYLCTLSKPRRHGALSMEHGTWPWS